MIIEINIIGFIILFLLIIKKDFFLQFRHKYIVGIYLPYIVFHHLDLSAFIFSLNLSELVSPSVTDSSYSSIVILIDIII